MPSSLLAATGPTPDCSNLQYSASRSNRRFRPRCPTRTPLDYQECCNNYWNPPVARGSSLKGRSGSSLGELHFLLRWAASGRAEITGRGQGSGPGPTAERPQGLDPGPARRRLWSADGAAGYEFWLQRSRGPAGRWAAVIPSPRRGGMELCAVRVAGPISFATAAWRSDP